MGFSWVVTDQKNNSILKFRNHATIPIPQDFPNSLCISLKHCMIFYPGYLDQTMNELHYLFLSLQGLLIPNWRLLWFLLDFSRAACVSAQSLQSCLTLGDPMDCILPGSSIYEILQARILGWVAMSSSRGSFQPRDWTLICLCLLHCRWILYPWSHLGSPKSSLASFKERCYPSHVPLC